MSYSDKSTEVQKLQNDLFKWGTDTFGELHSNPVLSKKLKEEVDELHTELERLHHIQKETFTAEYLDSVLGADEYIIQQMEKLDQRIKDEFADVFIMLLQSTAAYKLTFAELIKLVNQKFEINQKRIWNKPGTDGTSKHKKI